MTFTLAGLHVVSTATNLPGPLAASMLRDMGAHVAKVEPPSGDPLSVAAPKWYAALASNVEVQRLDLKSGEGRRHLESLLVSADLLITATRPASLQRLGLSWPDVHGAHPRLCQLSIVGYAAPRQDVAGHDLTYQAEAGLVSPPYLPRTFIADLSGAQGAVIAALDLLLTRERTGEAGYREVALEDGARLFAEPLRQGLTSPAGVLGGGWSGYNVYAAREGWIAVAALEPHFRAALSRELQADVNERAALTRIFSEKTAVEWERWAEARGLPLVAVKDLA